MDRIGSADRGLRAVLAAGQGGAGAALLVIARWLTWAWYQANEPAHRTGATTHLHAGRPGIALVMVAAVAVALAVSQLLSGARWLPALSCAVGAVGVVVAIGSALAGIAHANSVILDGGGTTSYGYGGAVAALAACGVTTCAAIQLARARSRSESAEDAWLRTRRDQIDPHPDPCSGS